MREIHIQSYAVYKGLFYWLNWPGYISNVILFPFAWVTMFGILGRFAQDTAAAQNYVIGMAGYCISFILVGGITQSYSYDKMYGTLTFFYVSPASRIKNYCCRILYHLPNAVIIFFFSMLAAWLVIGFDLSAVNWGALVVATLIVIASLAGYAQLTGVLTLFVRNWISILSPATAIMLVATGATIPIHAFPGFLEEICKLIPLTNGLFAIRKAFIGLSFSEISHHLFREIVTGGLYFIFGYLLFLRYENSSKKSGSLERDIQ